MLTDKFFLSVKEDKIRQVDYDATFLKIEKDGVFYTRFAPRPFVDTIGQPYGQIIDLGGKFYRTYSSSSLSQFNLSFLYPFGCPVSASTVLYINFMIRRFKRDETEKLPKPDFTNREEQSNLMKLLELKDKINKFLGYYHNYRIHLSLNLLTPKQFVAFAS